MEGTKTSNKENRRDDKGHTGETFIESLFIFM